MAEETLTPTDSIEVSDEAAKRTASTPDNDTGGPSRAVIVLLVVASLVGGFLLGRATDGGDGGETAEPGTDSQAEPLPFPSGDQDRVGYWGFANLEPTVVDTFDRPDDPVDLGDTESGQAWESVSGSWGLEGGVAVATGGNGPDPSLAVVPDGSRGHGLIEVTMTVVEEGAGLVFRYRDPDNYWSVTADPSAGSWLVWRVIAGEAELIGEVPAPVLDGVTVSVTSDNSIVRVLVEGDEYFTVTDEAFGQQLQGGLIAAARTTGSARWDRFLVMRFR